MNWNNHSKLKGTHSFLSPSQPSWLNDTDEQLIERRTRAQAAERGTRLHNFAAEAIELGQRLPRTNKTLNMYVNDALGYKMDPEVPLYYSPVCYGTADTICFRNSKLRIHDLKTGITKPDLRQLYTYAALFCLEYDHKPSDIDMELRFYQSDEIFVYHPEIDDICHIMDEIEHKSKLLLEAEREEGNIL